MEGVEPKQEQAQDTTVDVEQLTAERDSLDESYVLARKLLTEAIEKEQGGKKNGQNEEKLLEANPPTRVKLAVRIRVPQKEHPKYNFVGKLLGPKGSSLKQLQADTGTRMSILGRNSMRDKNKEEELRNSGEAKHAHLHMDLHVLIEAYCPAAEAYSRIGHALTEVKKYLIPDPNDEIRQGQLMEMGMTGGPPARGGGMGRGRGGPGRGMARGAAQAMRPMAGARGGPRGGLRGRGAIAGRGRAAPRPLAYQQEEEYYDDGYGEVYDDGTYDESYGEGLADDGTFGYGDAGGGDGYQSYDYGGYGGSTQTGSYGSQASSVTASYGGYGASGSSWSTGGGAAGSQRMKAPSQYTTKPAVRSHPYPRY